MKALIGEILNMYPESYPKPHSLFTIGLGSWGKSSAFVVSHVYDKINT